MGKREYTKSVERVQINVHDRIDGSQTLIIEMKNADINVSTLHYQHSGATNLQVNFIHMTDEVIKDLIRQLAKSLKNKQVY